MLYFPQLVSGATVQYPFVKRRAYRTVSNTLLDGRTLKLLDAGGIRMQWEFAFQALSEQERAILEGFVQAVEGRLGEFTLLDPTDNLLFWSGNIEAAAWTKGPLISVTGGVGDPNGGTGAFGVLNTGAAEQSIQQTINGPGWYCYCFSVYARSAAASVVTLFRSTGGVTQQRDYRLSESWKRLVLSGRAESAAESVTFGLTIPPAAAMDLFGMQAEAQPAPSAYRKTTSRSGIYTNARFEDDSFWLISEGPEQHSCRVHIGAPVAS